MCALGAAGGCGDDDGDGRHEDASGITDSGSADSGLDPDSGLPLDASRQDASRGDASQEDASADGGSNLVTVTFEMPPYDPSGLNVFFLRQDSSVIAVEVTDADGRAQAMFDETGMVVIDLSAGGPEQSHSIWAYLSVPPGSDIYFGYPPYHSPTSLIVNGPAYPGATLYEARTGCGTSFSATTTVTVALQFCRAQTHVLWVAYIPDGTGGNIEQVAFTPQVDVEAGTVTLDDDLAFHAGPVQQTTTVTGVPPIVGNGTVDLSYHLVTAYGSRVMTGESYFLSQTNGEVSATDTRPALTDEPAVYGNLWTQISNGVGSMQFYGWVDHVAAPTLDLVDKMIPWVSLPTFDAETGTLRWTEEGTGTADVSVGTVFAVTDTVSRYWRMIAPHGATELVLPRLPEPFAYLNIEPTTPTDSAIEIMAHTDGYQRYLANYHGTIFADTGVPGDTAVISY